LADQHAGILKADAGAQYDQHIHINLSELRPGINGPFTPDLYHLASELGQTAREKDWPVEVRILSNRQPEKNRLIGNYIFSANTYGESFFAF